MKKQLLGVLALLVGVAVLGYWRGWFSVASSGITDVRVDNSKFKQDKEAFGNAVSEKTKVLKGRIAGLWAKTEGLAGDEKAQAKQELTELEKKHERLEKQLKELEEASSERFESLKEDLSKSLEDVENKIEELTQKLAKGNNK